ncbi:MAG: TerB family tellurite resistance protein [Hyphomonadaceae bacterium]|nr:TerB family tellurite resistance protein [Hyphomonadaceae bacterium]
MSQFFSAALAEPRTRPNNESVFMDWARMAREAAQQKASASWSVPEAYFALLFTAATCDGELAPAEHETLLALVHRSRALKSLTAQEQAAINAAVVERLQNEDNGMAAACAALPTDMRLPAFAQALDLILADGELKPAEASYLNQLVAYLELAREDVQRVAEIMMLKNKY